MIRDSSVLDRLLELCRRLDVKFLELPARTFGAGFGVAYSSNQFVVVSVSYESPNNCYITAGVLKSATQDRYAALEACNELTGNNPAFPVFLHDANDGWSILIQQQFPIQLLLDCPPFLVTTLEGNSQKVLEYKSFMFEKTIYGTDFTWEGDDPETLLLKSLF